MVPSDISTFERVFGAFGLSDLVDVIIVSVVLYSLLVWFKRSRAVFVVIGMLIVGLVYLVSRQFGLALTSGFLQAFFAVFLVAVVVIFQEEIRQFFERIASRSLAGRLRSRRLPDRADSLATELTRTLDDLARERIGALVVIKGKAPLDRHLEGCVPLAGALSTQILASIFDPHSPGHDGAVVLEGDRISRFGCRLPLSANSELLAGKGTRHAAGLGLSELTDALVLVVSEERGQISLARDGAWIEPVDRGAVGDLVTEHYRQVLPGAPGEGLLKRLLLRNLWQKALAVGIALMLWFIFVHEAATTYRNLEVPVEVFVRGEGLQVSRVEPARVEVIVSGARSAFYFFDHQDVRLVLRLLDAQAGGLTWALSPADFQVSEDLRIESVRPEAVRLELRPESGEATQ